MPDAPSHQPDGAFEGNDDYSYVPSWKKWTSALVLILTVGAMIFEKQLGVKLYVSAWVGALVLVVIFVLGVFMTNFMSNTATCALLVPIGLSLASQLGFDPKAVLAAIVIASSLAYATPIGMPANTMVYNIAGYSFMDYVKAGLPLIVVSSIVALVLLPILFPF